jgi:MscS family membrane protein
MKNIALLYFIFLSSQSFGQIFELDMSTPEATINTFYNAMSKYSEGLAKGDKELQSYVYEALETLKPYDSVAAISPVNRSYYVDKASMLKEILDRTRLPKDFEIKNNRLVGTNITFVKAENGQFKISNDSLSRATKDYSRIKNLPYLEEIEFPGAHFKSDWAEQFLPESKSIYFWGLSYYQWIFILASFVLAFILFYSFKWFVQFMSKLVFKKSVFAQEVMYGLGAPIGILTAALALSTSASYIGLSGSPLIVWSSTINLLYTVSLFWAIYCLIKPLEHSLEKITAKTRSELDDQLVPLLSKTARVLIVLLAALSIIQSLGVNVFSILAGIGVGGLAIALAAKDTAANFFGSLMILFDQPFSKGDWIKINNVEGTVEDIGFRSTKIRTFYDSLAVVPNATVAESDIDNMGRRKNRRCLQSLHIYNNTPNEKIEAFVQRATEYIQNHPKTKDDSFYINFNEFGESYLKILLYIFLTVSDYGDELKTRQEVLLGLKKILEDLDIPLAVPSQRLTGATDALKLT